MPAMQSTKKSMNVMFHNVFSSLWLELAAAARHSYPPLCHKQPLPAWAGPLTLLLAGKQSWPVTWKARGYTYSSARLIFGVYDAVFSLPQAAHPVMYFLINALAFFIFLYPLVVLRDRKRRGGLPYPPGPPSRLIIGNLLDITKGAPWTAYADMSKKYGKRYILRNTMFPQLRSTLRGDVICLRVFTQVIIVLCSLSAIKDLFEKRAKSYPDRPTLPILEMYALYYLILLFAIMIIIRDL